MSVKSKHSTTKNDKTAKKGKRKKSEDSEDLESSEEELDLTKECHPIGHYINNRAEMINQMFSVIRGNKLKAMLPPILKDCDLDVLKLQCLDQLLGMSEKRIACILEGEVLETSSESEVDSNDYDSDEKNKTDSGSSSDGMDEVMNKDAQHEVDTRSRKVKRKNSSRDNAKAKRATHNDEVTPPTAEQGRTLLEILELEMRARAIRALLKQNESGQEGNAAETAKAAESMKENGIGDATGCGGEVVDLTGGEDDDFVTSAKKEGEKEMVVDEKETTFEEKVEKSKVERGSNQERGRERAKRLQAESELRNKLFKKQICRVKQLRGEAENDSKVPEVKQEEMEVEDPEEGELSSSEDGTGTGSKQGEEFGEVKGQVEAGAVSDGQVPVQETERRSEPVKNENTGEGKKCLEDENSDSRDCLNLESEDDVLHIDSQEAATSFADEDTSCGGDSLAPGETSWRERWLRKDGVQKLVKSSKIYAKVKKRIAAKTQRSKEETTNVPVVKTEASCARMEVDVIEGSIEEYEKLVGKSVKVSEDASEAQHCNSQSRKTQEGVCEEKSPRDSTNAGS